MNFCNNVLRGETCNNEFWTGTCDGDTCNGHRHYRCGDTSASSFVEYKNWYAINYIIYCQNCVRLLYPEGIIYMGTKKILMEK